MKDYGINSTAAQNLLTSMTNQMTFALFASSAEAWATSEFKSALNNEIKAQQMLDKAGRVFSNMSATDQDFFRSADTAWSRAVQTIPADRVYALALQVQPMLKMIHPS